MNKTVQFIRRRLTIPLVALVVISLAYNGCTSTGSGSDRKAAPNQRTFASPDDAAQSLIAALRANDTNELTAILGPDSADLISTDDPIADRQGRNKVVEIYDAKHQLKSNPDESVTMVLGNDDWPAPIPIVKDESGKWFFDTDAGKDEMITRRIGRNELDVIQVCKAIGDAQREYAHRDPDGDGVPEYARKLISDTGTTDGLYWPVADGQPPSPLGDEAAAAQKEGYSATPLLGDPRPYHGYYYRILTAQGKDAPGGAMDYVVDKKLIGGFAVVAWPADYGNSGIMTFITNHTGDVYQKDLDYKTDELARAMTEFNPDPSWKKAEEDKANASVAAP